MSELSAIEAIAECYRNCRLNLTVLQEKAELRIHSLREISFDCDELERPIVLTCFDEYRDCELDNPVLWLHLILDCCEGYEEATDFGVWVTHEGFSGDDHFFFSLYRLLAEQVPNIRKVIGAEVRAVDSEHLQFGTNVATELRAYQL